MYCKSREEIEERFKYILNDKQLERMVGLVWFSPQETAEKIMNGDDARIMQWMSEIEEDERLEEEQYEKERLEQLKEFPNGFSSRRSYKGQAKRDADTMDELGGIIDAL